MGSPRRRRVLIGAYACGPVEEPEASAGWAFATAAAATSDVWVITRKRFADPVAAALADDPELARHLTVVHMDLPEQVMARRRRDLDLYWYYVLWQRRLTSVARSLHSKHSFDVAHHVTFANDWLPCGLANLPDLPLVWGPVGGSSHLPYWRLRRWLGVRGVATEIIRDVVTAVPRRVWGDRAAQRAALVVAQNDDVARRFARASAVVVEPNAALDPVEDAVTPAAPPPGPRVAVYAGRLIGLKGVRLAIDAVASLPRGSWRFDIFGDGYDREALERRAAGLGLSDHVRFLGHRPRQEVLDAFLRADAMLFPSMHDQAGWAAAEASSLGCPVVCVPLGGPPVLARPNDFVASLEGDIVGYVAAQLQLAAESGGTRHNRWSRDRLPGLVDDWYSAATGAPQSSPDKRRGS